MDVAWVDIGSNLTHRSFDADRDDVIVRATAAGVTRQIVTGADLEGSAAAAALAESHVGRLWSTAGVHPHHAAGFDATRRGDLTELVRHPRVVAVGECGLDYFRNLSPPAAQQRAFRLQLEVAAATHKPVFLHQRDSHDDFMSILREFRGRVTGVAHCFTGDAAQLEDYLEFGLCIGITGWVCDERRGAHLQHVVPRIPADRLMLETDAPYLLPRDLSPQPKSRRNEPQYLPHIARTVARLRGESVPSLAAATTRTALGLFGIDG